MLGFCPLGSGSKGNCIYIGSSATKILIDVGLSCKAIVERLQVIGVDATEIAAIMITHEHIDHIRGLATFSKKYGVPICANSDTAAAIESYFGVSFKFKIFTTGERFSFGDIDFLPFSVQHDAVDPVAFVVWVEGLKLGICADLGFVTPSVKKHLAYCDYLYIEANHEPSMVHASARPLVYKQRVLGRLGHLSNEQCAELVRDIYHPQLRHIHLAHLSSECNAPLRALERVQSMCIAPVAIAKQDEISHPIVFPVIGV